MSTAIDVTPKGGFNLDLCLGPIVADKNCEKIHYMAPNIYCCGAGTAADTEAITDMVSLQLKLHRFQTDRNSRVVTALTLLKTRLFGY
ncbi:proteasome subunit beta type-7-B-like [Impatiens glandulifera]|uniref:proteasome subunit beta type-7-B-like n=1 Tax=Impatiens glandulifera TaxID=253017 RepID=UPI001FB09867|nr:proteasome subunit beta type-7-B-like [Impatiens glandulifera]